MIFENIIATMWNHIFRGARGKRPSGYRHRIKGANLLTILEYGANPHDISPTFIPAKGPAMLRFLAPLGGVKSMFAGTVHAPGKGLEAYLYKDDSQDSIFAEGVHHPGVTGDHLIQDAQRMIEARLAVEVSTVLRGVAATLV